MRTTLIFEPDVEQILLRKRRRTDKSMKAVVNDTLRVGLGMRGRPPRPRRFKVQPHAFAFKPGIDVYRLNQLVDEQEVDERARQLLRLPLRYPVENAGRHVSGRGRGSAGRFKGE